MAKFSVTSDEQAAWSAAERRIKLREHLLEEGEDYFRESLGPGDTRIYLWRFSVFPMLVSGANAMGNFLLFSYQGVGEPKSLLSDCVFVGETMHTTEDGNLEWLINYDYEFPKMGASKGKRDYYGKALKNAINVTATPQQGEFQGRVYPAKFVYANRKGLIKKRMTFLGPPSNPPRISLR
jgi:hypothetical protein